MNTPSEKAFAPEQAAISVLLERREIQRGRWSVTDWQVIGAVAGQGPADQPECTLVHSDDRSRRYLCRGLQVALHKDSAESYWYNLVGRQPSLFVICAARGGHAMAPLMVSADYDEAAAHMETDARVFATPMPPEIYRWLENFVLTHYEPQEPKKRKRQRWADSES